MKVLSLCKIYINCKVKTQSKLSIRFLKTVEDYCIDNIIATLKSQHQIHSADSTTSNSQRCTNFVLTLDSKFT